MDKSGEGVKPMLRVYGESDDMVIVEGTKTEFDEIGCFDSACCIEFEDGTEINVSYPKRLIDHVLAVWEIKVEKEGTAKHDLKECFDEDADCYSDIFNIDSEIKRVTVK